MRAANGNAWRRYCLRTYSKVPVPNWKNSLQAMNSSQFAQYIGMALPPKSMAAGYPGAENRGMVCVETEHALVGMLRGKRIYLTRYQRPTDSLYDWIVYPCHHHMPHRVPMSTRVHTQTFVKDRVVRRPA
jgi:hypothetical protein